MAVKKILIIKMSALGDVVAALSHIEVIISQHQHDDVWLVTSPLSKDLVAKHPRLKVAILDRVRRFGEHGLWSILLWVRRQEFARVYDLQGNRISRLLVRFSGSAVRVGTQPHSVYNYHPHEKWTRTTQQNVFDRLNDTLTCAGLPQAEKAGCIYLDHDSLIKVEQWKKEQNLEDKKYVVMHAGCSNGWASKRWPVEYYLRLAEMIEELGLKCIWMGHGTEKNINNYLSEKVGIDSTGLFSLPQVYELSREALFAVSNDSCPMHIFAAAGIAVYSFFGPTNWMWSHPFGQRDRVLRRDIECSPCFRGVCPKEMNHACLKGIRPEAVLSKIDAEMHISK